jgi:acetyl esterase/lipase
MNLTIAGWTALHASRRLRASLLGAMVCLAAGLAGPHATAMDATPQPQTIPLWPAGAPTLQGANEKEQTIPPDPQPGQRVNSIKNVHVPSLEVHLPPPDEANGAAVIVAPGGGHSQLVWGTEGLDIAAWLNNHGITAFILKYRLAQTPGYKYTVEGEALQDTQRALRMVRARAGEWKIDPKRVGVLGFSAGGALAALAAIRFDGGKADAADLVDRQSCRPDFVGLVYPGWSPRMEITVPKDASPAFLTSAGLDDASHARQTVEFYNALFKAGVPADLHIYAHGGHGGGIHSRKGIPFGTWQNRFIEWMADLGMMKSTPDTKSL